MPFEVYKRGQVRTTARPQVTIQKRGVFSLNRAAYDALGEPDSVELLFDRDRRIIGIREAVPESDYAYPVRQGQGKNTAIFMISGMGFTKYYEIPTEVSTRYPAELVNDMLRVNLRQSGKQLVRKPKKIPTPATRVTGRVGGARVIGRPPTTTPRAAAG